MSGLSGLLFALIVLIVLAALLYLALAPHRATSLLHPKE